MLDSRKVLALVLLPAVLLAAAACSSGTKKQTPSPAAATTTVTAAPTVAEGTPTPTPEAIGGVPVVPLRAGAPAGLPAGTVLYVEGGCVQCDGPATTLDRVYIDQAGTLHGDRLFERQLPVRGGVIHEENYIRTMRVSSAGNDIVIGVCDRGYCGGVGNATPDARTTFFSSRDGGVTWDEIGQLPGDTWIVAADRGGAMVRQTVVGEDGPVARLVQLPAGMPAVVDPAIDLLTTDIITVGDWTPLALADDGMSLLWLPGPIDGATPWLGPELPDGSQVVDAQFSPAGAQGGLALVRWLYPRTGTSAKFYLGLVADRQGKPVTIFGDTQAASLTRLGAWLAPSTLVTNVTLPATALESPNAVSGTVWGMPALVDLKSGEARAIRQLVERRLGGDRTRVLAAVPGPFVRVKETGDCLNVRSAPSTAAETFGCFKDGVLLKDRGETRSAEGLTWVGVEAPGGVPGWASAEFLDVAGREMGTEAAGHPRGTRTGDAAVDAVIAAVESGDRTKVNPLVQFQSVGCTDEPGLGGPPKCPEGVAEGTEFEVIPAGGCEGSWFPKDEFLTGEGGRTFVEGYSKALVYAVYRPAGAPGEERWPEGEVIIVYATENNVGTWAMTLGVTGGKIVSTWGGCGTSPEQAVEQLGAGSFILAPRQ